MPIDRLGKLLFPRLQLWRRRREIKTILAALLIGFIFAAIIGAIILLKNFHAK